jgi:hypothetical protein
MKKTLVKLLVAALIGVSSHQISFGQSSPYTLGSLGLMQSAGFTQHDLMGGMAGSFRNKGDFSLVNPASLSALQETSLQTGSFVSFIDQKSDTKRRTDNYGDFGQFALGIPISIKKHIGFAAGINRMTSMDYVIPNTTTENGNDVINVFAGEGGVNRFQTALGAQIFKGFSLGIEANFLFGNTEESIDKQFPSDRDLFSLRRRQTNFYSGVRYTIGAQYTRQIFKSKNIILGMYATPSSTMSIGRDEIVTTYHTIGNYFIDTLANREDSKFTQDLPLDFGASISFGKEDVWSLGIEYNTAKWSDVAPRENDNPYFNQESISIGGFWQAKAEMNSQHASKSVRAKDYLKTSRIYYGLRMQNLYTGVVDKQVQEMTFSLGLGLPLKRQYTLEGVKYVMFSRINVGVEYTVRGNTDPGMIQENILGIKFGLNLTDKWFIKRKYQ